MRRRIIPVNKRQFPFYQWSALSAYEGYMGRMDQNVYWQLFLWSCGEYGNVGTVRVTGRGHSQDRDSSNSWINAISDVYLWENRTVSRISGEIHLSDIVYVNGKSNSNGLQLTHNSYTICTTTKFGLHGVDRDPRMTGFIKSYAWRYENEVRLHIHLAQNTGYEKIMVKIPSEVLNAIEITSGPSFLYKNDALYEKLYEEEKISPSSFTNLVHYRPLCAFFQNSPFTRKI